LEGWADVAPTTPDGWYCRKIAGLLVSSAQALILEDAAELTGRPAENLSPGELDRWLSDCRTEAARRPIVLNLSAESDHMVTDEKSWTFGFSMTVPDKDKENVGYPVSWLNAPPLPYPQAAPDSILRRVERDFIGGKSSASRQVKFTAKDSPDNKKSPVNAAEPGKLTSTALYRGHLYQQPTLVSLVGAPTREWIYTPPQGQACFAVQANRADVAGAVTILLDRTQSMNTEIELPNGVKVKRFKEAKDGLELVLKQLDRGTKVTLAYFYGDESRDNPTIKPYGPTITMDGDNWKDVHAKFIEKETAIGDSTPLAGAIREVLAKDNVKEFWPENFTGSRTLIVLTDGEDNWGTVIRDGKVAFENKYPDRKEPGEIVLNALQNTPLEDVNLHIIFFGATSKQDRKEIERAMKQFEPITLKSNLRVNTDRDQLRTPGQLWDGVVDAKTLAKTCRQAMLPRFPYKNKIDGKYVEKLEASLREEFGIRPTLPLKSSSYQVEGLREPQSVLLRPGDRLLCQARLRNEALELFLPPYAYETISKANSLYPRASSGTDTVKGIYGTIPELTKVERANFVDLSLTVTLEAIGERRAENLLEVTRPIFAWFDAKYEDGKPAQYLSVENRSPLWAPGWNLKLDQWEPGTVNFKKSRHPIVQGYWLDVFPVPDASYPVNINDLPNSMTDLSKQLKTRVRESDVTLLEITREEYSDAKLPRGEYLTVRINYGKPGEPVIVRPGNLKGINQPYELYERHLYYDSHARYTARFGPISDNELNKKITLVLYSVAGLKDASMMNSRWLTFRFPAGDLETLTMPQELTAPPRKE
jgi:hypothetical protein